MPQSQKSPIIITTCTKRKAVSPRLYIPATTDLFDNQQSLAAYWHSRKTNPALEQYKIPAKDLYNGRSFKRALQAAKGDPEKMYIISAGLGLISATDEVLPYDITISSAAPNRISRRIAFNSFDSAEWWRQINEEESPIAGLITELDREEFIIAVSREYLAMIQEDLLALPEEDRRRVSIVGYNLDEILDIELFDRYVPYDDRLNAIKDYQGSKLDFSSRAATHLVTEFGDDLENAPSRVAALMDSLPVNMVEEIAKKKVSDEEVFDFIRENWEKYNGRKTMLLRVLRERLMWKCAQNRFDGLYEVIKSEREQGEA